jgi:RNA polymerase sigma-70 factor (ECF subfamily)
MLKNIANGDKNALRELYDAMSSDIYTFLLMFCKDKYIAEDALHDAFITIYEKAHTFKRNPKAWILTIAKNKAVSIIRKNARTTSIDDLKEDIADTAQVENIILNKIHSDMLVSVLSEEDEKIIILHVVYGFKHREIAELMNMPLGTVTWRYKQSIEKMKNSDKAAGGSEVFLSKNKHEEVIDT